MVLINISRKTVLKNINVKNTWELYISIDFQNPNIYFQGILNIGISNTTVL